MRLLELPRSVKFTQLLIYEPAMYERLGKGKLLTGSNDDGGGLVVDGHGAVVGGDGEPARHLV